MTDDRKKEPENKPKRGERIRIIGRDILNAFTEERQTGLADGAGAPGSTSAGNNRAGMPAADQRRGKRE